MQSIKRYRFSQNQFYDLWSIWRPSASVRVKIFILPMADIANKDILYFADFP